MHKNKWPNSLKIQKLRKFTLRILPLNFFKIEEDMLEAFQAFEDDEEPDDEEFVEQLCLDTGICTDNHHDEL